MEVEVASLVRTLESLRRRTDAYKELDPSGYLVLRALEQNGPTTTAELADRLGLDSSTVSRQLWAIDKRGYVRRQSGAIDRRVTVVSATASGIRAMECVRQHRVGLLADLLHDWDGQEISDLAELLAKLNVCFSAAARRGNAAAGSEQHTGGNGTDDIAPGYAADAELHRFRGTGPAS
jgi:DNA-binding MarR family transcriptional regulator